MSLKQNFYTSSDQFQMATKTIQESSISEQDKKDLLAYTEAMSAHGISERRMLKNAYVLRKLSLMKKSPFRKASKDEIVMLVAKIERDKNLRDWSKYDEKVVLKRFYKWLLGKDENYPVQISWVKLKEPKDSRLPEEMISEEEIKKLVEIAKHPRDKAFIFLLYESGCRVGEILSLQVKNVQFGDQMSYIIVNGKTGQRRVPLIACAGYLSMWINMHPLKDTPNAPLWIKNTSREQQEKGAFQAMSYGAVRKILSKAFLSAGIKKRFNPHNFRHSRATSLANSFTEAQLKEMFGWTQGSDMASRYVHLSGRDVDKALLKSYGLDIPEEERESPLKPLVCARCKITNSPTFKYCSNCGAALSLKVAVDLEDKRKSSDSIMNELIEDPEVQKILIQKIRQKGLGERLRNII